MLTPRSSDTPRWTRALGVWAMCAMLVLGTLVAPIHASAQGPADVAVSLSGANLPGTPPGFESAQDGRTTWVYPAAASDETQELRDELPELRRQVAAALGALDTAALTIRVARGPADLSALAPVNAPPPAYASGVAYPSRGLILLSLTAPESGTRPAMRALLIHELTHVALHRRVAGTPVPRWFTEGLAVQVAEEQGLERIRALWGASSGDALIPLSRLSQSFPSRPFEVNIAYAQSADFVGYLIHRRPGGAENLAAALDAMASGQEFERAMSDAYAMPLDALDAHWRADVEERYHSWPLALGGGTVWVLAILMLVVGFFRKRRRDKRKLESWAEDERALDHTLDVVDAQIYRTLPKLPTTEAVPTVEHEGEHHTLH